MKKRALFIVGALMLCATIVVGATLAYLADSTDAVVNTFVYDASKSNIKINLLEPDWNENNAKEFIPGKNILKNPHIELESGTDAYVAIIVEGSSTQDLKTVKEILEIVELVDYNPGGAYTIEQDSTTGTIYAYYKTPLAKGAKSAELFKSVKILNTYPAGHADAGKPIPQSAYKSFDLVLTGYAVQATNDDAATWDAVTAIKAAFPDKFPA